MPPSILTRRNTHHVQDIILAVLLFLSSIVLSAYLRMYPHGLYRPIVFILSFLSFYYVRKASLERHEKLIIFFFSCLISLVLVLGFHIHTENQYLGTIEQNYITPYSLWDVAAFVLMLPCLMIMFSALLKFSKNNSFSICRTAPRIHVKRTLLIGTFLFVCSFPYLLVYWPGVILGDTLTSISQALGYSSLTNHHPVMYTLYMKLCMLLGKLLFCNVTTGYALYTITQMLFVCSSLAYMIDWLWRHMPCGKIIGLAMVTLFALSPHFSAFSIAGWKDPVFSAAICSLSVQQLDKLIHPEKKMSFSSAFFYAALLLLIVFTRNNGIGVLFFVIFWQISLLLFRRIPHLYPLRLMTSLSILTAIIYFAVTGPLYDHFGITTDKREANALFLQQLARVGALNGDMTDENQEYLNSLLPIELYPQVYTPCCVDMFKWDARFNPDAISSDMYKNWLSLFLQNPVVYFEAWELNTFGFWTLNVPKINYASWNILGGAIENPIYDVESRIVFDLQLENLLKDNRLYQIFITDEWSVPIGWIFWGTIFLAISLISKKQYHLLGALIPTFGLMFPLILFTPICYWIRYAFALQYLLPFYLFLFFVRSDTVGLFPDEWTQK